MQVPHASNTAVLLTANEYIVIESVSALPGIDWAAETASRFAATIGAKFYLSHLYGRLGLFADAIRRGEVFAAELLPILITHQAEINRVELMGNETGLLPAYRQMDAASWLPALVVGEGVYVLGTPQVKEALTAAGVGVAPVPTNAWQAFVNPNTPA